MLRYAKRGIDADELLGIKESVGDQVMFELSKEFWFAAAHSLPHLPEGHKCARLHGHNYKVVVTVVAEKLDDRGFAGLDYAEFKPFEEYLQMVLDHRNLDEILKPSTTEKLAQHLWCMAAEILHCEVRSVAVYETPTTCVVYRATCT